jgi:FixJ family two-component response regulator
MLIAIVDDDKSLLKALARLLAEFGYCAECFSSAEEFLSAAATRETDCLLVDVNLGDSSGLDLVRQLSEDGIRIPVIFMSGSGDQGSRRQAIDLGCIRYLHKPFPPEELIAAVQCAIQASQSALPTC